MSDMTYADELRRIAIQRFAHLSNADARVLRTIADHLDAMQWRDKPDSEGWWLWRWVKGGPLFVSRVCRKGRGAFYEGAYPIDRGPARLWFKPPKPEVTK